VCRLYNGLAGASLFQVEPCSTLLRSWAPFLSSSRPRLAPLVPLLSRNRQRMHSFPVPGHGSALFPLISPALPSLHRPAHGRAALLLTLPHMFIQRRARRIHMHRAAPRQTPRQCAPQRPGTAHGSLVREAPPCRGSARHSTRCLRGNSARPRHRRECCLAAVHPMTSRDSRRINLPRWN
jgi:hypothetical protein